MIRSSHLRCTLFVLCFMTNTILAQTLGYPLAVPFPDFGCEANNGDACHVEETFTLKPGQSYCRHTLTKTHGGSGSSYGFVRNSQNSVTAYVHAQSAGAPNGYGSDSHIVVTIYAIPSGDDRKLYGDQCTEPQKWKQTADMCLCVQGTRDSKVAGQIAACFDKQLNTAACIPAGAAMSLTPTPVCRTNANECEIWAGEQCNVPGSVSTTAYAWIKNANYCARFK